MRAGRGKWLFFALFLRKKPGNETSLPTATEQEAHMVGLNVDLTNASAVGFV